MIIIGCYVWHVCDGMKEVVLETILRLAEYFNSCEMDLCSYLFAIIYLSAGIEFSACLR